MAKQVINCLLVVFFMLMLQQDANGSRIKRANTQIVKTGPTGNATDVEPIKLTTGIIKCPAAKQALSKRGAKVAEMPPPTEPFGSANASNKSTDGFVPRQAAAATTASIASKTSSSTSTAGNATKSKQPSSLPTKMDVLEAALEDAKSMYKLNRAVRRLNESLSRLERCRRHDVAPVPPYVYYKKMLSPDGRNERNEFELISPNMMIEGVQQELSFGPELLPLPLPRAEQDFGAVLVLGADERRVHSRPAKHHNHRHISGAADAMSTPITYLLRQFLQPANDVKSSVKNNKLFVSDEKNLRSPMDTQLYQLIDQAVEESLRDNPEAIARILDDEIENGHNDLSGKNGADQAELKVQKALQSKPNEDELVVSCPIHHQHHINGNGAIVDNVVMVNECHII